MKFDNITQWQCLDYKIFGSTETLTGSYFHKQFWMQLFLYSFEKSLYNLYITDILEDNWNRP